MRIAIANDLCMAQTILRHAVARIKGASVAWIAADGREALEKCRADRPDLILMDMVMPVMDGAVSTRAIMKECPCPILIVTSTIDGNLALVYEALSAGAIDAVHTPTMGPNGSIDGVDALANKARVALAARGDMRLQRPIARASAPAVAPTRSTNHPATLPIVAIGSSTGGPHALSVVLRGLACAPTSCVLIVQHIDVTYAPGLATWLTGEIKRPVTVATDGEALRPGAIVVASTSDHLVLREGALHYVAEPLQQVFRPSVDVFFESLKTSCIDPSVAILLTGMGRDGAVGLRNLRDSGWHTIAQDEQTSVVWGMPRAAVELGGAVEVLPLEQIGTAAVRALQRTR